MQTVKETRAKSPQLPVLPIPAQHPDATFAKLSVRKVGSGLKAIGPDERVYRGFVFGLS